MITDIFIAYTDEKVPEFIYNSDIPDGIYFHFYDELTRQGKKDAYKLKSHWGARQSPFAVVYSTDRPIKVFYTEDGDKVINDLIDFLEHENSRD